MEIEAGTLLVILGMALATYLTRIGGLFLVNRIPSGAQGGFLERFLRAIPGCVLTAIAAPAALASGPAESGAALAVILTAIRTKSLALAMLVGVAAVILLRRLF